MKAIAYSRSGTKTQEVTLPKVFSTEVSQDLLKQAVLRSQANLRQGNAKTLTRGEVRGGGRKPWKQKGTGRARFGSSRVNIWRHGGVAHGPTGLQNYQKDMPTGMIRSSLRMALSEKAQSVVVIEKLAVSEPKTRLADALLNKIDAEGSVLIVATQFDEKFALATDNLPGVKMVTTTQLRTYDILLADCILIEKPALDELQSWLGVKKTEVKK